MSRLMLPGLIPTAFQRSVLANSTAVAVNGTVRAASRVLDITVEGGRARMNLSAPPTLNTGVLIYSSVGPYRFYDYNGTSAMRFQRTTGTVTVQIQGYKYAKGV